MRESVVSRALAVLLLVGTATFAQWESADSSKSRAPEASASSAFSTPQSTIPPYRLMMIRESADFGNRIFVLGALTTAVSTASFWTGFFFGNGLLTLGFLGQSAGIPLMGIGSGQIQDAALISNPEARTTGVAGWPLYFAGMAAEVSSVVVLVSNIHENGYGEQTISQEALITSLGLLAGGQILYYASWYNFSRRRTLGRMGIASSVSLLPSAHVAANGHVSPGANLMVRF